MHDRAALTALLSRPNPHDITAAADAERRARHGRRTSGVVVDHLDLAGAHHWCTVTGTMAPEGGFARDFGAVSDATTDLVLLPPPGATLDRLRAIVQMLPTPPAVEPGEALPTVQIGTSDDWIDALHGHDAKAELSAARARGVRVMSDGVFPRHHPAFGEASHTAWASFWRAAAAAGMRGHAVVLYGPALGLESVMAQLDAIAQLQRETGVFLSLAPCVVDAKGFGGPADHLLTHASLDLRVLAACRLVDTGIDHLSLRYERSDLKSAHTALLCGVDDLVGHLFLGARDRQADADHQDLSVAELRRWLEEAGFEATLRNGAFEAISFESVLEWIGEAASSAEEGGR